MKTKQTSVTVSRTFNLGNFESLRIEAGIVTELEEGDTPESVRAVQLAEVRESLLAQHAAFKPKRDTQPKEN